jgi:hypothetical protein
MILARASATKARTTYRDAAVSSEHRKTPVDRAFRPLMRGPLKRFHGDSISPKAWTLGGEAPSSASGGPFELTDRHSGVHVQV